MTVDETEEKPFCSLLPSESHRWINLKKRDHRDYYDEEASPVKTHPLTSEGTAGRLQKPKIKSRGSGASQPPPLRRSKAGVELWNKNIKEHLNMKLLPQHRRSQQAFMQSGLSQPSPVVLSGTALHNVPAVQHQELAKAQSSLAFQQTSNTQPIPILCEHQLSQASGLGGSQLIDTHLLQARASLTQASNLYSGQVQQPGQTSFYNTAQSPSALQQVTVPIPGSQLSLPNFGSAGQPLIALPQSLQPPLQHTPPQPQAQSLSRPAQVGPPFRGLIPAGTQHSIIAGKISEIDLKAFGSGIDVKPGTPPVTGRSTTPTSLLAKQRAEVLQSTQRFFSEQQQSKPTGGKIQKVGDSGNKAPEVMADSSGACQDKVEEKPNPAPATVPKPVRTGPIKPQAIKTEETKS